MLPMLRHVRTYVLPNRRVGMRHFVHLTKVASSRYVYQFLLIWDRGLLTNIGAVKHTGVGFQRDTFGWSHCICQAIEWKEDSFDFNVTD